MKKAIEYFYSSSAMPAHCQFTFKPSVLIISLNVYNLGCLSHCLLPHNCVIHITNTTTNITANYNLEMENVSYTIVLNLKQEFH